MTLLKWVSTRSIFKRILGLCCFGTGIQQKTMRLFIFKIKALHFFSQLLCSTDFEHDKHVMMTMLNNQRIFVLKAFMIIKRKRKFDKRIDDFHLVLIINGNNTIGKRKIRKLVLSL